jgi:hypothetical protein
MELVFDYQNLFYEEVVIPNKQKLVCEERKKLIISKKIRFCREEGRDIL